MKAVIVSPCNGHCWDNTSLLFYWNHHLQTSLKMNTNTHLLSSWLNTTSPRSLSGPHTHTHTLSLTATISQLCQSPSISTSVFTEPEPQRGKSDIVQLWIPHMYNWWPLFLLFFSLRRAERRGRGGRRGAGGFLRCPGLLYWVKYCLAQSQMSSPIGGRPCWSP